MVMSSMPNLPGAVAVTDTLEFMKSLWGGAKMPGISMPGMVMPTLSVDEINKQIADLKAVESWLTVNMNMLHGTIKALEVQSATIATLQSMSASFAAAIQPAPAKNAVPPDEPPPFESPFKQATAAAPQPEPPVPTPTEPLSAPTPMANPAAWWTMLQDQFKQAVASATVPVMGAAKSGKAGSPTAATKSTKPPRSPVAPKARSAASKSAAGKPAAARRKAASGR